MKTTGNWLKGGLEYHSKLVLLKLFLWILGVFLPDEEQAIKNIAKKIRVPLHTRLKVSNVYVYDAINIINETLRAPVCSLNTFKIIYRKQTLDSEISQKEFDSRLILLAKTLLEELRYIES